MAKQTVFHETNFDILIVPNALHNPPGRLADVELLFTGGLLNGMKLIGFSVWEHRARVGRKVTFPARIYSMNGERRSFALLRPVGQASAQDAIRDAILAAYAEYEAQGPAEG